jgi:hypothetical protein
MKQENESKVFTELRRIRSAMLAEEKRVGSDKFWADVNRQGKEVARRHGLKFVESRLHVGFRQAKTSKKQKVR